MTLSLDYRALFEQACDGMLVLDRSTTIVQANAAFAAFVGRPLDRVMGRRVADFVHPDDLRDHPLLVPAVARDGSAITLRRFVHADGTLVEGEVASTQLADGAILCVVRDAHRRPAVNALRDSEALFRAVAANLNAGLVVTDVENRAVYVNRYLCERTGYAAEELLGRPLAPVLFPPHEQALHAGRLERRLAGVRESYDVVHRCKDGSTFLGEISASPLHDGEGRVIGTVGVMIDVTERYVSEREIAEREQRYRLLFEVTPLPAWVYDVETLRFLAVNPAAVQQYGYSEREFLAMTILDIRPSEDAERVRARVKARREGYEGQSHGQPFRHRRADGVVFDVEIASYAFEFEGRAARIVVVNDVTERARIHRRERELEAQLLLAHKMEAVGRLAGGVAHDFNNLLSVVLNAAGAIGEALPAESPLREDVADIRQAAERGAALTRQLLAFGRKEVHAPGPLDVDAVVTNVERLLARALGGGVRLEVRRGPGDARTIADASQLEQVLVNLAINARDAMPDGGRVTITTAVETLAPDDAITLCVAPGAYVTIEVADDGVGMDEATRARAFEPFYTTKGPQQGSGLGLSTVYGIVRQSAGAVTLASAPGAGTRVKIYLPRSVARAEAPARDVSSRSGAAPSAGTVLLVEDEPRVRAQARRLLERCGYAVIEAADGAEGASWFDERGSEVDVVVSDIMMPRLGGVEMVAKLRTIAPDMPVVFVSGYTAEDRALPLDARTAFVPKPYTIASLCAAIAAVVAD